MSINKTKKSVVLRFRVDTEDAAAFNKAANEAGEGMSIVMRDLVRAVPEYVVACKGRWYPPRLIPLFGDPAPEAKPRRKK